MALISILLVKFILNHVRAMLYNPSEGAKLDVIPVKTVSNTSLTQCVAKCKRLKECRSVNFAAASKTCEMLPTIAEEKFLTSNISWEYITVKQRAVLPCNKHMPSEDESSTLYKGLFNWKEYCDINTDGGGWTLVGNLDGNKNGKFPFMKARTDDVNNLWKVKDGKTCLSPIGLKNLYEIFPFNQIRWYCERGSKTTDIAIYPTGTGHQILQYILFNNITKPTECPGVYQTSANRDMPVNCDKFVMYFKDNWSPSMLFRNSVVMKNDQDVAISNFFFDTGKNRYQCAESAAETGKDGKGVWKLYVR